MFFGTLDDLSNVSGVGIRVFNEQGERVYSSEQFGQIAETLNRLQSLSETQDDSADKIATRCQATLKQGGLYFHIAPYGLFYAISSFGRGSVYKLFAMCGPMVYADADGAISAELCSKLRSTDRAEAQRLLKYIPSFSSKQIKSISEQLFINCCYLGAGNSGALESPYIGEWQKYGLLSDSVRTHIDSLGGLVEEQDEEKDDSAVVAGNRQQADGESRRDEVMDRLAKSVVAQLALNPHMNIDYAKGFMIEHILSLYNDALHDGIDVNKATQIRDRALLDIDSLSDIDNAVEWFAGINDELSKCTINNFSSNHAELIRESLDYIRAHIYERISLEDVAMHVCLNPVYLSSIFKAETGMGFKGHLVKMKIEESKVLLDDLSLSISDIAYQLGFSDQSYFTRVFKQIEGRTPNHYRMTRRRPRCD